VRAQVAQAAPVGLELAELGAVQHHVDVVLDLVVERGQQLVDRVHHQADGLDVVELGVDQQRGQAVDEAVGIGDVGHVVVEGQVRDLAARGLGQADERVLLDVGERVAKAADEMFEDLLGSFLQCDFGHVFLRE
jgi:hypothetical protein